MMLIEAIAVVGDGGVMKAELAAFKLVMSLLQTRLLPLFMAILFVLVLSMTLLLKLYVFVAMAVKDYRCSYYCCCCCNASFPFVILLLMRRILQFKFT